MIEKTEQEYLLLTDYLDKTEIALTELRFFIGSNKFLQIEADAADLVLRQEKALETLVDILKERVKLWKK